MRGFLAETHPGKRSLTTHNPHRQWSGARLGQMSIRQKTQMQTNGHIDQVIHGLGVLCVSHWTFISHRSNQNYLASPCVSHDGVGDGVTRHAYNLYLIVCGQATAYWVKFLEFSV